MLIKIEETSNPNIRNFYPEQAFSEQKSCEFADAKSLRKSPLAEAVFDLGGIESVIIAADMVSVTKKDSADWTDLSPQIMAEILDFIATGEAAVIQTPQSTEDQSLMQHILALIDARIRPALNRDGGDIVVRHFEDGILSVELTGKCATCPYAMQTLKGGVEKVLKNYVPQIIEVKPVSKEIL